VEVDGLSRSGGDIAAAGNDFAYAKLAAGNGLPVLKIRPVWAQRSGLSEVCALERALRAVLTPGAVGSAWAGPAVVCPPVCAPW
jgi:hypothetical protein